MIFQAHHPQSESPKFSHLNWCTDLMFIFSTKLWERYVQYRKRGELRRDVQVVDDRRQLCKDMRVQNRCQKLEPRNKGAFPCFKEGLCCLEQMNFQSGSKMVHDSSPCTCRHHRTTHWACKPLEYQVITKKSIRSKRPQIVHELGAKVEATFWQGGETPSCPWNTGRWRMQLVASQRWWMNCLVTNGTCGTNNAERQGELTVKVEQECVLAEMKLP